MLAVLSILRGISQIFFVQNALSGVLILGALALAGPWLAVFVLLGSAVQSLSAWAVSLRTPIPDGLMGYNGALVGAAAAFHLADPVSAALMTIAGAAACVPVHELLRRLFATRGLAWASMPVGTAPFCIVAGLLTVVVAPQSTPPTPTTSADLWQGTLLGVFNNYSEVILADGLWTGVVFAIALIIGSRAIGAFALFGSLLAVAGVYLVTQSASEVSSGVLGYSAVLAAIGIGAVCWADRPLAQRLLGATVAVALTLVIQPVLALTPAPVYTWPFLGAMWIVLLVGGAIEQKVRRSRAGAAKATEDTADG